ncbi:MAG TPA: hypothetical protein VFT19_05835 [Solirubrobacterales bacterium]|nr:hypothetical protein [Solirubrobacterales bacterium]
MRDPIRPTEDPEMRRFAAPWAHIGLNIESPQVWQVMSSVVLIRAIVWCSPQLGHCETNSKRLRQYTQRKRPGSCVGRSQGSLQLGQRGRFKTVPFSSSPAIPVNHLFSSG